MAERLELLNHDFTAAESATRVGQTKVPPGIKGLSLQMNFTYVASAATSIKAYVQTSHDNGETWTDIACFAVTTTSMRRLYNLRGDVAVTSIATPTDGSLTDNTSVNGLLGDLIAVKYVSVGTYGAGTNVTINAVLHG